MFTSFNSLPIYIAHSLPEQGAMREFLEENGIEYSVSPRHANAPEGFFPTISPDMLLTQPIEYTFLIYKKDYEKTAALLDEKWHWEDPEFLPEDAEEETEE